MDGDVGDHAQILSITLFKAILNNNLKQVRSCISQGVDLKLENVFHKHSDTNFHYRVCPLAKACCLGHEEIVEALLKSGAEPDQISGGSYPRTVLRMAADEGGITFSMIQTLISYGIDLNLSVSKAGTPLLALYGRLTSKINDHIALHSALKLLLDNGAYNSTEGDGPETLLKKACSDGNVELVKLFIADLKINDINDGDRKLLETATLQCDNVDMLNFLLDAGVNRHLEPDALYIPYRDDNNDVLLRVLNTCDVDLNMACDGNDMTILLKACKNVDVGEETVKVLLHHGADVRIASSNGNTVIHYASQHFDCNKLYELLPYNPPMNTQNDKKQTPLVKLLRTRRRVYGTGYTDDKQPGAKVITFQMLVAAGANITAKVERELNKLHHEYPQTLMSDYEVSTTRSLKEMCRFVIRGALPVPVDGNLSKLPVPELLQEYLSFSELRPLVDEYCNMYKWFL